MFYQLKDRVRRYRFAKACKGVLQASPVAPDASSNLVVLSQVQHKDVLLLLLAVKSFARQVRPRTICVLNDGSLSANDRAVLREHIPGVNLLELAEFRSAICPRGGTWERLLAIASLVRDHYVIQLDSDTLTIGPIEEVRHSIECQSAFALGTWNNQKIETMRERCETAKKLAHQTDSHVQVVAEASLDKLDDFESLRYVRGCSGFAGFARQSFTREFVEAISGQMQGAIGAKWSEWGSEQVMSNIVIANIPNAIVLPHPKYADCHKMQAGVTEFIHFIGSCRFDDGNYARLGAQVIARL
ncbi:MAG: hypothetical protein E6H68_17455 [Betaproteobacteria bacterium]|nr:MAG: hypothetical protein E6H68_17455 [Betaproteobacteria bacterium]